MHGFFHGVRVLSHDFRLAFDAINHSGGARFIYPMFGILIFAIVMAVRHRGGSTGTNPYGGMNWRDPPSSANRIPPRE
jgi:hypothetical protein